MSSVSPRTGYVKPLPQTPHPADRDYEFHTPPKELSRDKNLSDAGYRLAAVLLNDARFRSGGNVSRASNERLMEETGFGENKLLKVFKELETLGVVKRVGSLVGKRLKRDYIEITWRPSETRGRKDIVQFGPPESGVDSHKDHSDPQNQGSWTHETGGRGPSELGVVGPLELGGIKEEKREKNLERTSTPSPSPTRPGSEPSPSSPGDEDFGLPPGWNVTLPPEQSAEVLRAMIGRATQTAPGGEGRTSSSEERPIDAASIRGSLRDARRAARGPSKKLTSNELMAQVEMLKARRAIRENGSSA